MSKQVSNQPLKCHGGKSYLAPWLQKHAPPMAADDPDHGYTHRNISFAGGLGEFWNWEHEGIAEAVNDANGELINFYIVLRDPDLFAEFRRLVSLTQFSQAEWQSACDDVHHDEVKRAAAFFVRYRQSRQGLGKDYATPTRRTRRKMNEQVSAWLSAVDGLPECHERLRRVEVVNQDFRRFIMKRDHERAFFYLDPPYLAATRSSGGEYGDHELSDDDHRELLELLATIKGRFMLSGYPSPLYGEWANEHGYRRHECEIDNKASSAKTKSKKIECVWCNYDSTGRRVLS